MSAELLYDETWKEYRLFPNHLEAEIALDLLKQAGIPAYKLGGAVGVYWRGRGVAKIYVRACDFDLADQVLHVLDAKGEIPEEELAAEAEAAGVPGTEE